jgi:hypothetical protein
MYSGERYCEREWTAIDFRQLAEFSPTVHQKHSTDRLVAIFMAGILPIRNGIT